MSSLKPENFIFYFLLNTQLSHFKFLIKAQKYLKSIEMYTLQFTFFYIV